MDDFGKGKSIIIYIPNDFGLPEMFRKNLEFLGFKVFLLAHAPKIDKISTKDYLTHVGYKIFKNDKSYKISVREKNRLIFEKNAHFKTLNSIEEKADFALILRPDLVNDEVLKKIKSSSKKMVGYQWDGIERYPKVKEKFIFFDQFFIFDKNDLENYPNFKTTTNFYFDFNLNSQEIPKNDVFFIGSHIENRTPILLKISNFLKNLGFSLNINVVGGEKQFGKEYQNTGVKFISYIFDFDENYTAIKNAKSILDLLNDIHNGLSFRTFEAIGFRKKLITNNVHVKDYDFYNPKNIFIINERKLEELADFISSPYHNLEDEIYQKYSFTNWLKNILRISKN